MSDRVKVAPGPLRRLRRNPLALLCMLVAGSLAVASAGVSDAAQVRLTSEINANWRGAYDILVRPHGARLNLEATHGVVEPNFLGFTGSGGITATQLQEIRAIPDVDLAAPVAMVGYIRDQPLAPTILIDPADLPTDPTLYRVTLTLNTSDGRKDVLVSRQTTTALLGKVDLASIDSTNLLAAGAPSLGFSPELVEIGLGALPPLVTPVMAVDPVAEARLIRPSEPFLDELASVPVTRRTIGTFPVDEIPKRFAFSRIKLKNAATDDGSAPTPVVPVVVSSRTYAPVKLTLDVEQIGHALATWPKSDDPTKRLMEAARAAGPGLTRLPPTVVDLGAEMLPIEGAPIAIGWSATSTDRALGSATRGFAELDPLIASRPTYVARGTRTGSNALSFEIEPTGTPASSSSVPGDERASGLRTESGREESYRTFDAYPLALDRSGTAGPQFYFAPVGEFDLESLDVPKDDLSYVPFGAYDPPDTELVAGLDDVSLPSPEAMTPTLDPAGLVAVPPLAITDLTAAELLRGSAPIDAVRVRVTGLDSYDAAAIRTVEAVAGRIAALGLDVDIVAGSSPQPVELYVPAYDLSSNPPADLGWVRQGWTTLGAASRVDRALTTANLGLLALSLVTATTFMFGTALVDADLRRRDVRILRSTGWGTMDILRRLVAEVVPAGVAILLASLLVFALARGSVASFGIAVAIAVELPLIATVGAWLAIRTGQTHLRHPIARLARALRVKTVQTYAVRDVLAHPLRSLMFVVGTAVAASAAGAALAVVVDAATVAGPTRLAASLARDLAPQQWIILSLVVLAGVLLVLLTRRMEQSSKTSEMKVLASLGWAGADVTALVLVRAAILGVVAAVIAGPASAALTRLFGVTSAAAATVFALLFVVATTFGLLAARAPRKQARS